jgi:hypothetical protein
MTVSELVKKLNEMPQDAVVTIQAEEFDGVEPDVQEENENLVEIWPGDFDHSDGGM